MIIIIMRKNYVPAPPPLSMLSGVCISACLYATMHEECVYVCVAERERDRGRERKKERERERERD